MLVFFVFFFLLRLPAYSWKIHAKFVVSEVCVLSFQEIFETILNRLNNLCVCFFSLMYLLLGMKCAHFRGQ